VKNTSVSFHKFDWRLLRNGRARTGFVWPRLCIMRRYLETKKGTRWPDDSGFHLSISKLSNFCVGLDRV